MMSGYATNPASSAESQLSSPLTWLSETSSPNLLGCINRIAMSTKDLGYETEGPAERLCELGKRLAEGRFHLAVLGQFKRGKSTLLNAILGEKILPTSVVPLTAIPTFIRFGNDLSAAVSFQNGRPAEECIVKEVNELSAFLHRFVTEESNPKNHKNVTRVDVFHPAEILQNGVVLIDTPGIGSTYRHNTEATVNFLMQCDAALFILAPDPPLTETEMDFLKQVQAHVTQLFFILNKVDYLSAEELKTTVAFIEQTLSRHVDASTNTPIFCVSARQALDARIAYDNSLWKQSGMNIIEQNLIRFLAEKKSDTLEKAIARKAEGETASILFQIGLAIRSFEMPITDLQNKLKTFEMRIAETEVQRTASKDLLAGEQKRVHVFLESYAQTLRDSAAQYLAEIIRTEMTRGNRTGLDEKKLRSALAAGIPAYFERQWRESSTIMAKKIEDVLRPYQARIDTLIESVRSLVITLFDIPEYNAPDSGDAFETTVRPYWASRNWAGTIEPIPIDAVDRLLPSKIRKSRLEKRLLGQIENLMRRNVENLRWALYQNIDQAFIKFGSVLDLRLAENIDSMRGAIKAAITKREQHKNETSGEIDRLKKQAATISDLASAIKEKNHEVYCPKSQHAAV